MVAYDTHELPANCTGLATTAFVAPSAIVGGVDDNDAVALFGERFAWKLWGGIVAYDEDDQLIGRVNDIALALRYRGWVSSRKMPHPTFGGSHDRITAVQWTEFDGNDARAFAKAMAATIRGELF